MPSQSASWASTEATSPQCPPSDDQVIEPIAIVASHAPSSCAFTALCRPSLIVLQDGVTLRNRERITALAARTNLPAIYQIQEYVRAGGLMSYGLNYCDHFRRAGEYVGKVLGGTKPSELPVELPSKFELVINLKAARAMGITVPPAVVLQADAVID